MGNAHMGPLSQMQEIEVVTVAGGLPTTPPLLRRSGRSPTILSAWRNA